MPETWKEAGDCKATLRQTVKAKTRILRRPLPNDEESYETFYCYSGPYLHKEILALLGMTEKSYWQKVA